MTKSSLLLPEELNTDGVAERLVDCQQPFLIGVRHHSAAMARCIGPMLDAICPEVILLELPPEFSKWLPWVAHPETVAPLALAGCPEQDSSQLSFYPFADFSPELVVIRWAAEHNVPVELIDLPIADRRNFARQTQDESKGLLEPLLRHTECQESGQLWDRLVESRAPQSSPEQIRQAALLFGWIIRWNQHAVSSYDRAREHCMRGRIHLHQEKRCVAVVGSFHAAALLPEPVLWSLPDEEPEPEATEDNLIATALIPYSFEQLDERSGYPAGVKDPMWQQAVIEAKDEAQLKHAVADLTVAICREMRAAGHPMNAAAAQEVVRVAADLATVRGLVVASRQELLEALQLCLSQGQIYGIGKAVAAAMQTVLVGHRSGNLPSDVPRCGLAPAIDELLNRYRLPGSDTLGEQKRVRLDRLRSRLDRAREVIFQQLNVCHIPYATPQSAEAVQGRENLTSVWMVEWTNATAATIALSSAKGVTLEQAARGTLISRLPVAVEDYGAAELALFEVAAECGFHDLVNRGLNWITGSFARTASLSELIRAMAFVDRLRVGHIAGMPDLPDTCPEEICSVFQMPDRVDTRQLLQAAIALLEGMEGSEEFQDVAGLLDLILWYQQQESVDPIDSGRLLYSIRNLQKRGTGLMQGASAGALLILNQMPVQTFHQLSGSWLDAAVSIEGRKQLPHRLQAVLVMIGPRLMSDLDDLTGLDERLQAWADDRFLQALPAIRKGFSKLTESQKKIIRQHLRDRHPSTDKSSGYASGRPIRNRRASLPPELQQIVFESDQTAANVLKELLPELNLLDDFQSIPDLGQSTKQIAESDDVEESQGMTRQLSIHDRWRLILGDHSPQMSAAACRTATALDELYGQRTQQSEEAGSALGGRGGQEEGFPDTREWNEELRQLFPDDVREEVLADALTGGRNAALSVLDHEQVRPSVELLEQVLSLQGHLADQQAETLRRLARRITEQLAKELATNMAPALTGLTTPRPTRRRTNQLNLKRTVLSNLHTARMTDDGVRLIPEQFYFQQPARRSMDWHIIYVLDISGSMEPSVIYSALTAAIFSQLPAVSVSFLAFNTEVIDFTGTVDDPLQMLLEVKVGGGTSIGVGLQAAREKMTVPGRTIVLLITDFEEGLSLSHLLAEVQAVTDSGARALGLAALSDDGKPRYHTGIAEQVAACGMPVAALSPHQLARWVGEQIR